MFEDILCVSAGCITFKWLELRDIGAINGEYEADMLPVGCGVDGERCSLMLGA